MRCICLSLLDDAEYRYAWQGAERRLSHMQSDRFVRTFEARSCTCMATTACTHIHLTHAAVHCLASGFVAHPCMLAIRGSAPPSTGPHGKQMGQAHRLAPLYMYEYGSRQSLVDTGLWRLPKQQLVIHVLPSLLPYPSSLACLGAVGTRLGPCVGDCVALLCVGLLPGLWLACPTLGRGLRCWSVCLVYPLPGGSLDRVCTGTTPCGRL